jgi:uncharacterized protein
VIVLDTTILIYAKGSDHAYREPCRLLVGAVGDGRVEATTTAQVLQEFAHVRARRRGRADAVELARGYADLLSPLLTAGEAALREGLRLFERHPPLGAFDAVLAAAALDLGADLLVSADPAFASVPGLRHVLPDAAGVAGLLGG